MHEAGAGRTVKWEDENVLTEKRKGTGRKGLLYFGAGFLASLLVVLAGFIIIRVWPFGDGTVLIIDSLHQYLPFYTEMNEKLRTGQSLLYDFSAGLGYDFWGTIAYYMASPLNLFMIFLPRAHVADFMDLCIMLKIALCGGIFSFYLHRRNTRCFFLPVVFGCMYALGNFLIGYYFNLMWLDSMAMLPLIMMGIERISRGSRGLLYGLSLFYALWCNYYIGFMLCIFACLYFLFSMAQRRGISLKQFLSRTLRFALYSLLSGGMAGVILLPAYMTLASSEAMQKNTFPSVIRFYTDFADIVKAHFIQQHPINISDSQVGLNAYCGTAVMILLLLYVLDDKIELRRKIGSLMLIGLFWLSFSLNILSYIWHGFHIQNGLPNRFAFIYVVLLLTMCYDTIWHIRTIAPWKILVSGAIPVIFSSVMIFLERTDAEYGMWNLLTPLLLVIYLGLFLVVSLSEMSSRKVCVLLGTFLLCEAGAHGIYGIIYNENVTRSIYLNDQKAFMVLTKGTGDTDFYRSEIDSQRMRNVTMYAGGNSVVMFNSTMQESVTSFCDHIGMEARTNKNGYIGVTTLMNDVLGIRYVGSSNGKGDRLYQMDKVSEYEGMTLYRNENALPVGFMTRSETRYWDIYSGNPIDVQNSFARLAAGETDDLYILDRKVELKDGERVDVVIPEGKQVYLYLPDRVEKLELNTPEYSKTYNTYTDHLYVINSLGEDNMASFTPKLKSSSSRVTAYLYTCRDEDTDRIAEYFRQHVLENAVVRDNHLSGTVDAGEGGILLLTIPYSKNWKVRVDGQTADALPVGSTLMGLDLTEGRHEIAMTYTPGGFYAGCLLSAISLFLFILTAIQEKKREKAAVVFGQVRTDDTLPERTPSGSESLEERTVVTDLLQQDPEDGEWLRSILSREARDQENCRFAGCSQKGIVRALREYYENRFGIALDAEEVTVFGSLGEAMRMFCSVFTKPGDVFLMPEGGPAVFPDTAAGKETRCVLYALTKEGLPDLTAIPEDVALRAGFMIIPVDDASGISAAADLPAFCGAFGVVPVFVHTLAAGIISSGEPSSVLALPGFRECSVEVFAAASALLDGGFMTAAGERRIIGALREAQDQLGEKVFLPAVTAVTQALEEAAQAPVSAPESDTEDYS